MFQRLLRCSVALMIALTLSFNSHAAGLKNKAKVDMVSQHFMDQVLKGNVKDAYAVMSAYVGIDLEAFNERGTQIATNMAKLSENIGAPLSYALVKQQEVEGHFYKLTYLLKYRSAALLWELNYYQPDDGWYLVDISFNTNINRLFE
ncbi:MAG: hypothetical protein R3183_01155 [Oleiphilaceae bacterium]|nr:hypothetical protein [Oleiphilaceae bacterium]